MMNMAVPLKPIRNGTIGNDPEDNSLLAIVGNGVTEQTTGSKRAKSP
jgi:predicted nucleic acid-binding protein